MRRFARTLAAAAPAGAVVAGTAGWASAGTRSAVTGPPPGTAAWRADAVSGRPLPDPVRATPSEVARFFAGLDGSRARDLVRAHPLVVGHLDGAPLPLRYEADRLAVPATGEPRFASPAAPGRQLLAFDPRGRGTVAEVFGDLGRAAYTGPAGMARSLRSANTVAGPRTGARVWAAHGPSYRISDVPNDESARFGHGSDRTSAAFSAHRIPAADVSDHTGYFTVPFHCGEVSSTQWHTPNGLGGTGFRLSRPGRRHASCAWSVPGGPVPSRPGQVDTAKGDEEALNHHSGGAGAPHTGTAPGVPDRTSDATRPGTTPRKPPIRQPPNRANTPARTHLRSVPAPRHPPEGLRHDRHGRAR